MRGLKVVLVSLCAIVFIPIVVIGGLAGSDVAAAKVELPADYGELVHAVLDNPSLGLLPQARGDVQSDAIDARVLQDLLVLAQQHSLDVVGPLITGHGRLVKGTGVVSNHALGRAVDIAAIDGAPVSIRNSAAKAVMFELLSLPRPLRPDELGGPWLLFASGVRVFTKDHGDHIHIGWSAN